MHVILLAALHWAAANPDQTIGLIGAVGTAIGGGFVAMAKHTKNTVDDKVAAKLVEIGHAIHPAVAEAVPVLLQAKSKAELEQAGAAVAVRIAKDAVASEPLSDLVGNAGAAAAAKVAANAGISAGVVAAVEQVAASAAAAKA